MCQLTVQPILQIARREAVQRGHFLEVITHACQRQQRGGTKSGEFSGLSLRCIQPASVSVGGFVSSQEGLIVSNERQMMERARIVLVWCLHRTVCERKYVYKSTRTKCTVYVRQRGGGGWVCVSVCVSQEMVENSLSRTS